jgi:mRNA interferase RelE/StbE
LVWKIEFDKKAFKEIESLDKPTQKRIISFLKDRLSVHKNPRQLGEALRGKLKHFWKYRVGDYRIICSIEDQTISILVLRVEHRRSVYKNDV